MAARALRDVRAHHQPGMELSSDRLAMEVLPRFGGRVVSLRDWRSGRDWFLQGRPPSRDATRTDAVYDAGAAWGWDECVPTVASRLDLVPEPGTPEAIELYAGPIAVGAGQYPPPMGRGSGTAGTWPRAPFLGIWISNGGWPAPGAVVRQHAVEPTTAPTGSLAAATDQGRALTLMPGERRSWWVTLDAGPPTASLGDYLAIDHRSLDPATDLPAGGRAG